MKRRLPTVNDRRSDISQWPSFKRHPGSFHFLLLLAAGLLSRPSGR